MSSDAATAGQSLVQQAVQAVRAYIGDQHLKVGDTLPGEGHFANQLGVSRAVMREAFGALAALTVAIGLAPGVLFALSAEAAAQLLDPSAYVAAVLGGAR